MKMILTKDDVMKILCEHFNFEWMAVSSSNKPTCIEPKIFGAEIYWEGNPEPESR